MSRVCAAFLGQLSALVDPPGQLSRYGLGRLLQLTTDSLATLSTGTRGTPLSLSDHIFLRTRGTDELAEQISGIMGTEDATTLARQLTPLVSELIDALDSPELPDTVTSAYGTVRLIDYLRVNTILVVDLAIDTTGTAQPAALAESVRCLAGVLTERYPGRSIEVRVPPHVAVQVGAFSDGPSHTRGTPPNVVETSARTFWELAIGRQSWTRALASGTLSQSGVHAPEAARMFPIFLTR